MLQVTFCARWLASAGAAFVLLGGGIQSASAGYFVITQALAESFGTVGVPPNNFANYLYNSCAGPGSCFSVVGAATASGTVDLTGTLTAAHDNAALNDGSASSFGAANLATGALQAFAFSAGTSDSQAGAEYTDTLHFSISGAGPSTVTNIGFHLSLAGSISNNGAINSGAASSATWQVQVGQASLGISIADLSSATQSACPSVNVPCISAQQVLGWTSSSFAVETPGNIVFNGVIAVTGAAPSLSILNAISTGGGQGGNSDYSHTSLMGLSLPNGVTYTSDSGVFDSGVSSGVPEPATFALIGLGLLGIAGLEWRKRMKR